MASHLRNASLAKLALTSIPLTKYNLAVALTLQRLGFLSFVTRGGKQPPDPATVGAYEPAPLTTASVAKQRLWVGLKYVNGEPVMRSIVPVSNSSHYVTAKLPALRLLARGFDASRQRGLNLGECIILTTSLGTMEVREAIERKVGGLLLCRVGS